MLRYLLANAREYGQLENCKVWIAGDVKTPEDARELASEVTQSGLETVFLDVAEQGRVAGAERVFHDRLPLNNECRRNLGYLRALKDGAQVLLCMDDDNFPIADDLIGFHARTGDLWHGPVQADESGFYNICEHLAMQPPRSIYARGFPFRLRDSRNRPCSPGLMPAQPSVGVKAGLWLRDPDIDATTWLNGTVKATGYAGPDTIVLEQSTWTPINTQNTSVVRELVPAFLCVPMGWEVPGGKIQRYGDIWGGYFLQALMKHTKYHVSFGRPLADHRRNPHDYLDDLRGEFWGLILTDWLVQLLRDRFEPSGSDVVLRVRQLASFLKREACPALPAWCPSQVSQFIEWTSDNLVSWADACAVCLDA